MPRTLPLFPGNSAKPRGPFIGDQRMRWLQVPAKVAMDGVKECLDPEVFRDARQKNEDIASIGRDGFAWVDISLADKDDIALAAADREVFLRDPTRKRLCLLIESGTGKSVAMQQTQMLRGTNPGHLTIGVQFSKLPTTESTCEKTYRTEFETFLWKQVAHELPHANPQAVRQTVHRAIKRGNLTLLVDALDQTQGDHLKNKRAELLARFLESPDGQPPISCVVAGRPYSVTVDFWDKLFAPDPNWCFTLISEFNESQQRRYIGDDRWEALYVIEVSAMGQPRLLESVRELTASELDGIRTASELHWKVLNKTFNKSNQGMGRARVYFILSLIAYQMHRQVNTAGVDLTGVNKDGFHDFLAAIWGRIQSLPKEHRFRPHFPTFESFQAVVDEVAACNAELEFAFLDNTHLKQIYFRNRTLQDFFAAMWLSDVSCTEDDQLWLASVRDKAEYEEFWKLLTEMPVLSYSKNSSKQQSVHWVRSMAVLFRPVGDETYPVRCSEWMYRAWWNLLLTSGLDDPIDPQPFFSASQPNEWKFNDAVNSLQKRVQRAFQKENRGPDWNQELTDDASHAAKILLTDHLREFLAIKAGLLQVPGFDIAVKHAKWFWEPSETSGFVTIPKGKFRMGENRPFPGNDSAYEEETEHEVEITAPFEFHRHPITEGVYRLFDPMRLKEGFSPNSKKGLSPFDASWYDASVAATWLHGQLPTEQQWERACRGPESEPHTFFSSGDSELKLETIAWFNKEPIFGPVPVVLKKNQKCCNHFGLYHMHGNVWEWTANWYAKQAWLATQSENPRYRHSMRVLRGGSYSDVADKCRSSYRSSDWPIGLMLNIGFRVSRT